MFNLLASNSIGELIIFFTFRSRFLSGKFKPITNYKFIIELSRFKKKIKIKIILILRLKFIVLKTIFKTINCFKFKWFVLKTVNKTVS